MCPAMSDPKHSQFLWIATIVTAVRISSSGTNSALELGLWSFGSHLAQYDWSSYHPTPFYTPNIYRPIDTP